MADLFHHANTPMTDREIIGDLPDELLRNSSTNGDSQRDDLSFEDGRSRTLQGESLISSGRVVTMAGPSFVRPEVGEPGEHVALRLYRKRLLQGELFLTVDDVITASKRYSGGASKLDAPQFPGSLTMTKESSVICVRKIVEVSGETYENELRLTTSEMTSFARTVAQKLA